MDYNLILNKSLNDFKLQNENMEDYEYKNNQKHMLNAINSVLEKEIKTIKNSNNVYKERIENNLRNIFNEETKTFEEALQRILFYNQLLWQTGHKLNGIGRLDKIFDKYYKRDIENNTITKEDARNLIREFLTILHRDYIFKSSLLLGDTGQIIILGGKEKNGEYFENELTYIIIEEIKKLQFPDPRVLLRVSENMPRKLMELSLECIKTGVGSPLFSNDDIVISKLIDYGYSEDDAYNYAIAACWEPYICGKSLDQNNIKTIVFIDPFIKMINSEKVESINNTDELLELYKKYLFDYLDELLKEINKINFEEDPIISLLTEDCNEKEKIITLLKKYKPKKVEIFKIHGLAQKKYDILGVKMNNFQKITDFELENFKSELQENGFNIEICKI